MISASLRELLEGRTVASSRLNPSLVKELMGEGLLTPVVRGSRKSYRAQDRETLRRYLMDKDESFRLLELSSEHPASRASQATATGNSKLLAVRSCPGFPVNTYEPIPCVLNGQELIVNPSEGSFLFVTDWQSFSIPSDVIVIGIENMENFRLIRRQQAFFNDTIGPYRLLFVSRYPQSTDLRSWLQTIPNSYIHFGDFDLAGIHIFLSEFHAYLPERSSYLIPSDIERRLAEGSAKRYEDQYQRFRNISTSIPELQQLIETIHKYHRCYDQEGFIDL